MSAAAPNRRGGASRLWGPTTLPSVTGGSQRSDEDTTPAGLPVVVNLALTLPIGTHSLARRYGAPLVFRYLAGAPLHAWAS